MSVIKRPAKGIFVVFLMAGLLVALPGAGVADTNNCGSAADCRAAVELELGTGDTGGSGTGGSGAQSGVSGDATGGSGDGGGGAASGTGGSGGPGGGNGGGGGGGGAAGGSGPRSGATINAPGSVPAPKGGGGTVDRATSPSGRSTAISLAPAAVAAVSAGPTVCVGCGGSIMAEGMNNVSLLIPSNVESARFDGKRAGAASTNQDGNSGLVLTLGILLALILVRPMVKLARSAASRP